MMSKDERYALRQLGLDYPCSPTTSAIGDRGQWTVDSDGLRPRFLAMVTLLLTFTVIKTSLLHRGFYD